MKRESQLQMQNEQMIRMVNQSSMNMIKSNKQLQTLLPYFEEWLD